MRDLFRRRFPIAVAIVTLVAGAVFVQPALAASSTLDQPAANPFGASTPGSPTTAGAMPGAKTSGISGSVDQNRPATKAAPIGGPSSGTPGGGTSGTLPSGR
jgi:hypothetical protein